jgi:Asp-tRNA(Asn)/Glu-tRNA(Gln) amidotransferase A subunit family amidase
MRKNVPTWRRRDTRVSCWPKSEARTTLYRYVEAWLERSDILLTPTLACPAVPVDFEPMASFTIDGREAGSLRDGWYPYTGPFDLTRATRAYGALWPYDKRLACGLAVSGAIFARCDVAGRGASL